MKNLKSFDYFLNEKMDYPYTNKEQKEFLKKISEIDLRDGIYQASITMDFTRKEASDAYDKYGSRFEDLYNKFMKLENAN